MCMLSLDISAHALDEYVRIGESTAMRSLKGFCAAIQTIFGEEYLRQPTKEDIEAQFRINEQGGLPRLFASLDCMHYQ